MRSVMHFTVSPSDDTPVTQLITESITDFGWIIPDVGLAPRQAADLARKILATTSTAHRERPVSPDSQYIQNVIDTAFPAPEDPAQTQQFAPGSFERHCLEQALLILTQIPEDERQESYQREMRIIVSPEHMVYGIIFDPIPRAAAAPRNNPPDPPSATPETHSRRHFSENVFTRLRSADLDQLQMATTSFVSALTPGHDNGASPRFHTRFSKMEIRSVTNEHLFDGHPIPISGRFALIKRVLNAGSARVLIGLSVALIIASALFQWFFPYGGWWAWTEGLFGRLATGAFGAFLVNSAIDYTALRRSLRAGRGPVRHGALIEWAPTS